MTTDSRKLARAIEKRLHLIADPSIRKDMAALCEHLIAALDAPDIFKTWIHKKLTSSGMCEPRTDELVNTDSEIYGWMHVLVGNAQSWKNILPMVDRQLKENKQEIARLQTELKTALDERDALMKTSIRHHDEMDELDDQIARLQAENTRLLKILYDHGWTNHE